MCALEYEKVGGEKEGTGGEGVVSLFFDEGGWWEVL